MKLIALLVLVGGCSKSDEPKRAEAPAAVMAWEKSQPKPAPGPWGEQVAVTEEDEPLTPREIAQNDIVKGLNGLFAAAGVVNAEAAVSDEDLMILTAPGDCDRKVLTDLRKGLVAMKLDPAKSFHTMQCNGGPSLKFR